MLSFFAGLDVTNLTVNVLMYVFYQLLLVAGH